MAGDDSEVTLNAFGKTVSIKGLGTIFVLIVLLFAGGLSFMLYNLSSSATLAVHAALEVQRQSVAEHRALIETSIQLQESHKVIIEGVKDLGESVKTQTYMLLADPATKEDIKRRLAMPKELRQLGVRER